jgi:hypothetical protein
LEVAKKMKCLQCINRFLKVFAKTQQQQNTRLRKTPEEKAGTQHDTQHNDIQNNDTQYNDIQHDGTALL